MRQILFSCLCLMLLVSISAIAQRHAPPGPKMNGPSRPSNLGRTPSGMDTGPAATHFNANQEAKVDFRSESVLVQVPVVVLDKQGKHIHGLTKDHFEVLENNKPKAIAAFEEITASNQLVAPEATVPGTFKNWVGAIDKPQVATIVVLDTINTPFLDQAYGRKELIRYLASNLDEGQAFALVILGSSGIRILRGLTQDPAELIQALKKLSGELPTMQGVDIDTQAQAAATDIGEFPLAPQRNIDPYSALEDFVARGDAAVVRYQQDRAIETTMRGFLDIAWSLSGVPGRKSLVWATGSFPFDIGSPGDVPGGYESVLYERAMEALNNAQISVYPVDVRGLVNTSPVSDVTTRVGSGPVGPGVAQRLFARNWLHGASIDTLSEIAEMTGGRAFYNTNDLVNSFHRAAEDSASYYVLSYYLDTGNREPGWRKLKVKVDRKDAEVRSRNGFFVTNATVNPEVSRKLDLGVAATSPFDSTGIPVTVQWTDIVGGDPKLDSKVDKRAVRFLVRVAGRGVSVDAGQKNHVDLDVLAFAFTGKGKETAADFSQNVAMSLPDDQVPRLREQGVGYRNSLELPPGNYYVRFVVRDNMSGRVGSVSAPLTVN